jgi:hypothetical protein
MGLLCSFLKHSEQALAPHTLGPRDVPRCGTLSLLQKSLTRTRTNTSPYGTKASKSLHYRAELEELVLYGGRYKIGAACRRGCAAQFARLGCAAQFARLGCAARLSGARLRGAVARRSCGEGGGIRNPRHRRFSRRRHPPPAYRNRKFSISVRTGLSVASQGFKLASFSARPFSF